MDNFKFPLQWFGVYEYDYNPSFDVSPEPVAFKLEFCFTNDIDFTGSVCDDANSSMPELGTVTGKLIGSKIEFVKQMPKATYMELDGSSRKFDYLHPKIYYAGEFISDENLMVGAWHFAPISRGGMEYPGGAGTWHADVDVNRI